MRWPGAVLLVALLVRAAAIVASDRMVADVDRYHRVATHVLDVSLNPYRTERLYPYPPVWMWFEAGAEWLARRTPVSFPILVKLPVLVADLALVALLAGWGAARGGSALRAGWLYALHPVAVLIGAFHGQFEALALLAVCASLLALERGRWDGSALLLAAGIAVKSFPVLLVPVLLPLVPAGRRRRYLLLSALPIVLILAPFAVMDVASLSRELFGYGGVADFGWIGVWRGLRWMATGRLVQAVAPFWATPIGITKLAFLGAYAVLVFAIARGLLRWGPRERALAVLLAFLGIYGALSAQYLSWVVPLACLRPGRALRRLVVLCY